LAAATAAAQNPCENWASTDHLKFQHQVISATAGTYRNYPSLTLTQYIMFSTTPLNPLPGGKPENARFFRERENAESHTSSIQPFVVNFFKVDEVQGIFWGQPDTTFKDKDKIWVCYRDKDDIIIEPAPPEPRELDNVNATPFTLSFQPEFAANQDLTNGTKRSVYHLLPTFELPVVRIGRFPARWYFKGSGLLSSDGKDKSSKLTAATGLERNLPVAWSFPVYAEVRGTGDQVGQNVAVIGEVGAYSRIPFLATEGWTKPVDNSALRIPFGPDLKVAVQRWWRVEEDKRTRSLFPRKDTNQLFSQFQWSNLMLLPGKAQEGEIKAGSLTAEVILKGWLIPPGQLGPQRATRAEGYFESSLLIPFSSFKFDTTAGGFGGFNAITTLQRFRVKYALGANEAKGFTHYHQITIGLEWIQ
jgi:hypothetical protein